MINKFTLLIAGLLLIVSAGSTKSQVVYETVTINPGYTHQVYYSLQNGSFPAVDNTDWDLGFQLRGFAASIIINAKNNVQLYRSMKSAADWNSIMPSDTTGIINGNYELLNSDLSWDLGAFNVTNDTSNAFDLGWGVYDFTTHIIEGDSLYFIKLATGDYKKFWLESLTSGTYFFRWADLDGSNEVTASLVKSNYPNKLFAYHSLQNNISLDREPVYNTWDLLFTQYLAITPIKYKVAGVLLHDSVSAARAYPVDVNNVNASNYTLSPLMNSIGYDWKTYDFANNIWNIEDSLVYFVQDHNAALWKIIFTGFTGSANGTYEFNKEYLGTSGMNENALNPLLNLYPNPAVDNMQLIVAKQQSGKEAFITISNSLGQVIRSFKVDLNNDINAINLDLKNLEKGFYYVSLSQNGRISNKPFIIQ